MIKEESACVGRQIELNRRGDDKGDDRSSGEEGPERVFATGTVSLWLIVMLKLSAIVR